MVHNGEEDLEDIFPSIEDSSILTDPSSRHGSGMYEGEERTFMSNQKMKEMRLTVASSKDNFNL